MIARQRHRAGRPRLPRIAALLLVLALVAGVRPLSPLPVTSAPLADEQAWAAFRASAAHTPAYQPPRCAPRSGSDVQTHWAVDELNAIEALREPIVRTLEAMETRFAGVSGEVWSFRPGADYPEVYIRDLATILPAAQFLFNDRFLGTAINEFLAIQYDDRPGDAEDALWWPDRPGPGAVSGIIRSDRPTKMVVVSDEETSLIHAAYVYYRAAGGTAWLRRTAGGKTHIERLNAALDWLWSQRTDSRTALVKRHHTTDWGDIAMHNGSPAEDSVLWVASIYDQALTYQALRELAAMNRSAGDWSFADLLDDRAFNLREATRQALWQPERGHFRTHLHITPLEHSFDENVMVSIANAHAMYTRLADGVDDGAIVANLEQARVSARASKPGLSLFPAYPTGTFAHPSMSAGSYQNGGIWDWWGGMQVTAEFQRGYAQQALQHLQQLAQDWQARPGRVWEWQHAGIQRNSGSPDYAGAAAAVAEAALSGLFGLDIEGGVAWYGPRLGAYTGSVQAQHPSSGCQLLLHQSYRPGRIDLDYSTNHPGEVRMSVLIPDDWAVDRVLLDGAAATWRSIRLGDDHLVLVERLPGREHRLSVLLRDSTSGS